MIKLNWHCSLTTRVTSSPYGVIENECNTDFETWTDLDTLNDELATGQCPKCGGELFQSYDYPEIGGISKTEVEQYLKFLDDFPSAPEKEFIATLYKELNDKNLLISHDTSSDEFQIINECLDIIWKYAKRWVEFSL